MYGVVEFNNPNANKLLADLLSMIKEGENIEISIDDTEGFYRLFFKDKNNRKCPFSLWISTGNGDNGFLNIGAQGQEATVFHFVDLLDAGSLEEIIDFLNTFLHSLVRETKVFCKEKLKRINYEVIGRTTLPAYHYLHESYFVCFNRRKEVNEYRRWQ